MASFTSILSNIGHGLKVFFSVATPIATAAEPFVAVVFPGVSGLFNTVVAEVGKAEGLAAAAGAQTGSGPQKLAAVVASLEGSFNNYAKANNITWDATKSEAFVNLAVQMLNLIPANPETVGK